MDITLHYTLTGKQGNLENQESIFLSGEIQGISIRLEKLRKFFKNTENSANFYPGKLQKQIFILESCKKIKK